MRRSPQAESRLPTIATIAASPSTTGKRIKSRRRRRPKDALSQDARQPHAEQEIRSRRRQSPASIARPGKYRPPARSSRPAPSSVRFPTRRSSTVVADVAATASAAAHQRRKRHHPQQRAHARQDAAFGFRHAADRTDVRPRQHLLRSGSRSKKCRASRTSGRIPSASVDVYRFARTRAFRQRIGGLGQRAHEKLPEFPGMSRKFLRHGKRHQHGIVFRAAGRNDSSHREGTFVARNRLSAAHLNCSTYGELPLGSRRAPRPPRIRRASSRTIGP